MFYIFALISFFGVLCLPHSYTSNSGGSSPISYFPRSLYSVSVCLSLSIYVYVFLILIYLIHICSFYCFALSLCLLRTTQNVLFSVVNFFLSPWQCDTHSMWIIIINNIKSEPNSYPATAPAYGYIVYLCVYNKRLGSLVFILQTHTSSINALFAWSHVHCYSWIMCHMQNSQLTSNSSVCFASLVRSFLFSSAVHSGFFVCSKNYVIPFLEQGSTWNIERI